MNPEQKQNNFQENNHIGKQGDKYLNKIINLQQKLDI